MWPEQHYIFARFPAYPKTFGIKQLRGRKYKAKRLKPFIFFQILTKLGQITLWVACSM